MNKFIKSLGYASSGIITVVKEEVNFRMEISIGFLVILFSFLLDFSHIEKAIIFLCMTLVLSAEILNTAIEDLCNKMNPEIDPAIGKIKDMMAGFVLVICLGASIVGILIFSTHF